MADDVHLTQFRHIWNRGSQQTSVNHACQVPNHWHVQSRQIESPATRRTFFKNQAFIELKVTASAAIRTVVCHSSPLTRASICSLLVVSVTQTRTAFPSSG